MTAQARTGGYRLGVDIGGTFTDIVVIDAHGTVFSKKLLSTPHDYSEGIEAGVRDLLAELGVPAGDIVEFVHATTVATNTIIERKGARVALVTTEGFRDVLEIARFRTPRLYDIRYRKHDPLVSRELRFEVAGRLGADGEEVSPLDEAALDGIAEAIRTSGVESVAVTFINAHVDPRHEARAAALLRERLPGLMITASSELVPQQGEYERTSTTVVNAYLRPIVTAYVRSLQRRLDHMGITAPLMIMQSSGGIAPAALVADQPITIIESGPAAGVLGSARLSRHLDLGDVLVFDMGGTTAKATLTEAGDYTVSPETEVGGGPMLGARMVRGAGYPVQVPTIDIAEVGAGGGSLAANDGAGGLLVGPRSAGSTPGPIAYRRGGTQPTVTDANLVLGYLNPGVLVGGELTLDTDAARRAFGDLAASLRLEATETAEGVHRIANATMLRAIRSVSSEKGRDPSQFTLLAIGGNGPVHACSLAEDAGMDKVVIPPVAGLFSALGMLFADVEHQLVASFYRRFDETRGSDLAEATAGLVARGRDLLATQGFAGAAQDIRVLVDVKYAGQTAPLTVELDAGPAAFEGATPAVAADPVFAEIAEKFHALHDQTFGYASPQEPLQFVALRAICRGVPEAPRMPGQCLRGNEKVPPAVDREAHFAGHGWHRAQVLGRAALPDAAGDWRPGPIIVEEYDTTCVIPPGWEARRDGWNNIHARRVG
ncbi:Acetophenone carboxylase gamma subunit [Starkeya nomas]|uniref:Acetophenone carboxylase gamma subunit n=1 Tax=Starkeya nomas TaxID=2666134 RepID=A0A5S9PBJ1_9HYPH|nr:hydantoinase/oxoprolinase family protein [Starkeya nomas]CAA0101006.1 Acetophenone carboxylase gamma subunit [Starkeya nomas]